jgi:hypothetical protein
MKHSRANKTRDDAREPLRSSPATDEKVIGLFESDVLAAEEYRQLQRCHVRSSEQDLVAAVLEQGIADYRRYAFARDEKVRKSFFDAEEWISTDECDWIFSFTNCCEVLGINPVYLRRRLIRSKESNSSSENFTQAA